MKYFPDCCHCCHLSWFRSLGHLPPKPSLEVAVLTSEVFDVGTQYPSQLNPLHLEDDCFFQFSFS
jgi:hypothetical protein